MKINLNINTANIKFKGYSNETKNIESNNALKTCISESHLMRDFDTTFFAKDYALKEFPNGTNIVVPGCSQMECYTWGTLLHEANADKKYKILGYDLAPGVIEDAKLAVLNIGIARKWKKRENGSYSYKTIHDKDEYFLISDNKMLSPQKVKAKKAFYDCFVQVPEEWKSFNLSDSNYEENIKKLVKQNQDPAITTKMLEYMLIPGKRYVNYGQDFIPKNGVFQDIINFKTLDIFDIDKELKTQSAGIFSFKNGLYHVLGTYTNDYADVNTDSTQSLFKKINSILRKNGLFIIGNLQNDHLLPPKLLDKCSTVRKKQDRFMFSDSPIHNLLKNTGFEPLFYDFVPMFTSKHNGFIGIYAPTIWKKIKHI